MERGIVTLYPIHMGVDERREELRQREQNYGNDVNRFFHIQL